jgi:regulator of protease activity HflC (stomatin/prohibitin superfamily)
MFDLLSAPVFLVLVVLLLYVAWSMFRSVPQATVGVVTVFGKYRRIMREGLNIKLPWEKVAYQLSLQNRALQLEFQAITQDQANVKFATMVLYAVAASEEEAIKKAVFSFASAQEFQLALQRTIDGSIRQFVATTKQSDILGMRAEIVDHTKKNLDEVVLAWGYVVRDIQITDMTFDKEIIDSMARRCLSNEPKTRKRRPLTRPLAPKPRRKRQPCAAKDWRSSARTSPTA